MYAYILVPPQGHEELAAAEFHAFTGCEAVGRLGIAPVAVDIRRAALISTCTHIAASGSNLQELCDEIRAKSLAWEGFRIEHFCPSPDYKLTSLEPVIAVADAITGRPNLTHPSVRLGLVATSKLWTIGPIVSEYMPDWPSHENRPHFFSGSLPTRFSRAMVNLVASPGDTLIDPCCGAGVALIEALAAGVQAVGCDINPKMIAQAAENLTALGLPRRLFVADARRLGAGYDAAILDLPYGRNVCIHDGLYADLLRNLATIARRVAVVAAIRLTEEFTASAGLRLLRHVRVPKNNLVRHLHLLAPDTACPSELAR
ncbi:MAG: methyltransferase domain-containing protein [candidate division WS1 bacterium]|jgi:tRNA G10  N-methylase Trm11|nr:methyltransferase domain-containing protein [candidate division WS1 bacterium]